MNDCSFLMTGYGVSNAPMLARGATFEALAPMLFSYPLVKGDNSNVFLFASLLVRK
ncbi:hypothetical protein G3S62_002576 [Shigella flexneri]|nr:hypothetical protein [Salmonella enterica subsp. enterica]EFI3431421.1 hypothetical protein [Escherichia coli]EFP9401206.1 hypothetical protein [Shigella flexneri]